MKFLKCHIENYGTLSNFDLQFNDKLTVINEENGFGKSTLCSFIMAMFYGLPSTTKRKVEENERKLRTPWQGGNFGGTLDFSINGKGYRIERFFGSKANSDTFRLFDLQKGTESNDYSENIGAEIFSIDADGFKRSIFFPQLDSELSANVSITAKLVNLIENSDDMSNFDNAMAVLKKRKSDYSNLRGRGFVPELESKILESERALNDAKVAADNVAELTKRLKSFEAEAEKAEAERAKVGELLQQAAEQAAVVANKKRHDELVAEIDNLKSAKQAVDQEFPCGLPEESVLNEAFKKAEELKSFATEFEVLKNDSANEQELDRLNKVFDGRGLSSEIIESERQKAVELSTKVAKCDAKFEMLKSVPSEAGIKKKAPVLPLGIVAAVSFAAGIAMLFVQVTVAIVLLVLGVVLFGVSAFLYLKNMIDRNAPKADVVAVKAEYEALKQEVDSVTAHLEEFFRGYGLEGSFSEQAYRLGSMWDNYCSLKTRASKRQSECLELSEKINLLKTELDAMLVTFNVSADNGDYGAVLLKMRDAKVSLHRLTESLETAEKRLAELPEVNTDVEVPELDREALKVRDNELKVAADELNRSIIELKNRINVLLPLADSVSELENDVSSFKEQLDEKTVELFTIEKAMEFLETAKANLSSRYRTPLSDGFKKYADIMLGNDVGEFLLDADFNLSLERFGKVYEKNYFSAGFRNLLDISARFALCDALYDGLKPPVVLDDPFVNLDEPKLKNALQLLTKLAEYRQIIYLTCHGSRVP